MRRKVLELHFEWQGDMAIRELGTNSFEDLGKVSTEGKDLTLAFAICLERSYSFYRI